MRVLALTGTPGTGKTTIADHLAETFTVVGANDLAEEVDAIAGRDDQRAADIVDEGLLHDRARDALAQREVDHVVVEGGLAHHCSPDLVVVLRCHPDQLRERLAPREWPLAKVEENVMAEILDVISTEVDTEPAWELDTTDLGPQDGASHIAALFNGEDVDHPDLHPLGGVDWSHTLMGEQTG